VTAGFHQYRSLHQVSISNTNASNVVYSIRRGGEEKREENEKRRKGAENRKIGKGKVPCHYILFYTVITARISQLHMTA